MTTTPGTKARTTRKIVGSLGVLGAAAAVAGLGTFGTFTDSTTPVDAKVSTGTLNMDLNAVNSTVTTPLNVNNMVPGDTASRSYDLANKGNLNFSSIMLQSTASTSNILTTDTTNGLQLGLSACSVTWTETMVNGAPTYTCSGTQTSLITPNGGSGALLNQTLPGLTSLTAGKTDHLVVTVALPTSAGNTFQGKSAALSISFTGSQASGTSR
jgi:Camelysin metallo-endopeptidase